MTALERFATKCRFDPTTGCVLWTGATALGQGKTVPYGIFWFDKARWWAHRWSAIHIHKLPLHGLQAAHTCPHGPDTLCVEHLAPQTPAENNAEQYTRLGNPATRVTQTAAERQYWLLVEKGIERAPEIERDVQSVPFYSPPAWLAPFLAPIGDPDDCPF